MELQKSPFVGQSYTELVGLLVIAHGSMSGQLSSSGHPVGEQQSFHAACVDRAELWNGYIPSTFRWEGVEARNRLSHEDSPPSAPEVLRALHLYCDVIDSLGFELPSQIAVLLPRGLWSGVEVVTPPASLEETRHPPAPVPQQPFTNSKPPILPPAVVGGVLIAAAAAAVVGVLADASRELSSGSNESGGGAGHQGPSTSSPVTEESDAESMVAFGFELVNTFMTCLLVMSLIPLAIGLIWWFLD